TSSSEFLPLRSAMPYCPRCGRRQETHQPLCADCEQDDLVSVTSAAADDDSLISDFSPIDGMDESRVAIARFQSGAEAGFFADELTRRTGIETDVLNRERFDPVHAVWTVDYMLLVAKDEASEAPRLLQELVDATGDDELDDATPSASGS